MKTVQITRIFLVSFSYSIPKGLVYYILSLRILLQDKLMRFVPSKMGHLSFPNKTVTP